MIDAERDRRSHPSAAQLVIEIARSSVERDLTVKPELYAQAVAEYWVLNLECSVLVVHRAPGERGYDDVTVHARDAAVAPRSLRLAPCAAGAARAVRRDLTGARKARYAGECMDGHEAARSRVVTRQRLNGYLDGHELPVPGLVTR